MSDPLRRGLVWPQRMRVTLGYPGSQKELAVYAKRARDGRARSGRDCQSHCSSCRTAEGLATASFCSTNRAPPTCSRTCRSVGDALTRGAAWVTLWDNVLEGHVAPGRFIDAAMRALPEETDEQNTPAGARVHEPRVLAFHSSGGASRARASDRGGAPRRNHACELDKPEIGMVQRVSR